MTQTEKKIALDLYKSFIATVGAILIAVCGFFLVRLVQTQDKNGDKLDALITQVARMEITQNTLAATVATLQTHNVEIDGSIASISNTLAGITSQVDNTRFVITDLKDNYRRKIFK